MKSTALLLFLVLGFFTNCKKGENNDNYIKRIELVNIIQTTLPQTSTAQSTVKIKAFAEAVNGCYSNFAFKFQKINDFDYTLKAYATFESNGICPDVMTGKDTVINFIPEKKGLYTITTNDKPFKIRSDTIIIN
jgi:hypothetical protein